MTGQRPSPATPSYGALPHYLGDRGAEYFKWQSTNGARRAQYNLPIWRGHLSPEHDVLDFGCGGGFLLKSLEGRRRVGVDINPHARAVATQLGIEVYANLDGVPGVFDRVISSHALEHVPHPREVLIKLRDRLRGPESRLLLLLPLDDWRKADQRRFRHGDVNQHLHTWTPQLLGNLLESADFTVERIDVITHAWPPKSDYLWQVSPALFHAAAWVWSVVNRQRQLFAMARRTA